MKFKRTLTLLLAALMLAATACGTESEGGSDTSAETEAVTTAAETEAETTPYMDTLPVENYDGYSFVMLAQSYDQRPNLPFYEEEVGEPLNDALIRRNRLVESRYSITIENVAEQNRDNVTNMVKKAVRSDEETYSMVINSTSIGMNTLTTGGCLYDLSQIGYLNLQEDWWCKNIYDDFHVDGHLFFTSGALSPFYYYTPIAFAYNKTVTDSYGITGLEEKVLDGSWTFDYMISLAKDKSYDLNGDSQQNEQDFWGVASAGDQTHGFGMDMVTRSGDGFIFNVDEDFLNKLNKVAEFADSPNNFSKFSSSDTPLTMFQNNQVMFMYTAMNNVITGYNAVPSWREMESDYGILPLPKYDENQEEYWTLGNAPGPNGIGVPITCSDPQRTGLIMETLAYYSYELVKPAAYDSIVKEKGTRTELAGEMLDILYSGIRFHVNNVFNFGSSNNLLANAVNDVDYKFMSQFESIRTKAEKALNDYIESLRSFNAD